MSKQPDRYSMKLIDASALTNHVDLAEALGLHWFAKSQGSGGKIGFYLFFDQEGMRRYLVGEYDIAGSDVRDPLEGLGWKFDRYDTGYQMLQYLLNCDAIVQTPAS